MSETKFTDTIFFKYIEVFVIGGILLFYFFQDEINLLFSYETATFIFVAIVFFIITIIMLKTGVSLKLKQITIQELDKSIFNKAFCPICGNKIESSYIDFHCIDCDFIFDFKDEVE